MGRSSHTHTEDAFFEELRDVLGNRCPRSVGPYEVIDLVASGGQGVIYRARDRSDQSLVALKRPHPLDGSNLERLKRGAALAARLDHPGILPIKSIEEVDGQIWVATAWIEGVAADQWFKDRVQRQSDLVRLFIRICDAVAHAHYRGVIHRDICPQNIIIRSDGSPCILDFGIAKSVSPEEVSRITQSANPVGNLLFMPPEVLGQNNSIADVRHDIYALGMLLYVMISGAHPLDNATPTEAFNRIIDGTVFDSGMHSGISNSIGAIIKKATSSHLDSRYRSVQEFVDDLERDLAGLPIHAVAHTKLYLLSRFLKRHRIAVTVTAAALITGITVFTVQAGAARTERELRLANTQTLSMILDFLDALGPTKQLGTVTDSHDILEYFGEQVFNLGSSRDSEMDLAIADLHSQFGTSFFHIQRFDDAIKHAEEANRIYVELLGLNHDKTQKNGAVLARLIGERRGRAESEAFTRSLIGDRPMNQIQVDEHLYNLAGALIYQRKFDEGRTYLDEYLLRVQDQPEEYSRGILLRAIYRNRTGAPELSLQDSRAAFTLVTEQYGPNHVLALRARLLSAKSLQNLERFEEEREVILEVMPRIESVFGPKSSELLQALAHLVICETALGLHEVSILHAEENVRLSIDVLGDSDWRTIQSRFVLANALLAAGYPAKVLPLLEPEIDRVFALKVDEPFVRHRPRYWVARAYNDLGRYREALEILAPVFDEPRRGRDERNKFLQLCKDEALRAESQALTRDE